ncbi:SCO3374 family protein [Streptomyces sp. NPDC060194]|uniref:SCO3374 family protein n=1 Tax=Streptomyces sp. NPDC060194 TaxID=3347069 RepID=UPI003651FC89
MAATASPPPRIPHQRWYERELGWVPQEVGGPGSPRRLPTGAAFDALDVPADAGRAVLGRLAPAATGPALLDGDRVLLLIAAGCAEEVPALLDWLEWRGVDLGLRALGPGGSVAAPGSGGSAVWLRPPEPGGVALPAWPAGPGIGGGEPAAGSGCRARPDLVRLLSVAATECHRLRLHGARTRTARTADQPFAFS